ncbi:MAG: hypothetical protein AB1656_27590 [Candidatus Omnitrophota bacterium]
MKREEQAAFFKNLRRPRIDLGLKLDLSQQPEIFGHVLKVRGLYIWGHIFTAESHTLSELECDVILYNETDAAKVEAPEGFLVFRLHDLQEFPYIAAVRIHQEEE